MGHYYYFAINGLFKLLSSKYLCLNSYIGLLPTSPPLRLREHQRRGEGIYILQGREMCFQLLSSGHDMIVAVPNS